MTRLRSALVATAALLALALPALATPPNIITDARYEDPTTRYGHGILGEGGEFGTLRMTVDQCLDCDTAQIRDFVIRLPQNRVFEDVAPRLINLFAGISPSVMVVESDLEFGARLAVYDESGLVTATPFIGLRNRWLAPLGAVDLDGDGSVEIAYVEKPHLTKVIRVWRFDEATRELSLAGELPGFTNHRIGEEDIAGGIRDCGQGPEMIVADANWQDIYAVTFSADTLTPRKLGPHKGRRSFARAMDCKI